MAKPFSKLAGDIHKVSQTIIANTEKRQREAALDIYTGLTRVNPKLTGRSAGSWQIGRGTPVRLISEPPTSDDPDANAAAAFVAGRVLQESSKLEVPLSSLETSIHITTIIEYIHPLNAGWSSQADPFWIEKEVERVAASAQGVKLLPAKVR